MPPKSKKRKTAHHHDQQSSKRHYDSSRKHTSISNGNLSHEEIWDDSALLRSWNDALAEYEFYHSIHAKGEDVDEVLRRAEEREDRGGAGGEGEMDGVDIETVAEMDPRTADGDAVTGPGSQDGDGSDTGDIEEGEIDDHGNDADKGGGVEGSQGGVPTMTTIMNDVVGEAGPAPIESLALPSSSGANAPETAKQLMSGDTTSMGGVGQGSQREQGAAQAPADQTLENLKMAYYWAGYYSGLYDGQRQAGDNTGRGET